ncbi:hypothetical protein [Lactiplantibacillus modestisalitolerans]|uniref:Phage protein n=1 Tax=Lactiplantibacillus modestisalitolerans TaxID=1457219 RepID=A0ABV5WSS2_9LACO|nr:hypothetical protein [Lactiplantibacillus modestisalitolerans]
MAVIQIISVVLVATGLLTLVGDPTKQRSPRTKRVLLKRFNK